jgi:hypothetical protein
MWYGFSWNLFNHTAKGDIESRNLLRYSPRHLYSIPVKTCRIGRRVGGGSEMSGCRPTFVHQHSVPRLFRSTVLEATGTTGVTQNYDTPQPSIQTARKGPDVRSSRQVPSQRVTKRGVRFCKREVGFWED